MALERISEPISNLFLHKFNSNDEVTLIDFQSESSQIKDNLPGQDYNFNFELNNLSITHYLQSLAPKPYREYPITDSELQQLANDIEYIRSHNHTAKDENTNKFFAVKLELIIEVASISESVMDVMLYNSGVKKNNELLQFINFRLYPESSKLKVKLVNFDSSQDNMVLIGGYQGNVNYTFNNGTNLHSFPE